MSNRAAVIAKFESTILMILSISMLPSLCIAFLNNETESIQGFSIIILVTFTLGLITRIHFRHSRYNLKNRDGFLIVALGWILASFIGALPYWASECTPYFTDAFFESCSGFTTTGASVITDIENVPQSILFWRSLTQWLGGLGTLIYFTAIAPAFGMDVETIADPETSTTVKNKLTSHFSDYSKQIYELYVLLTIVEIILLKIAGLSFFDAFIHTFGTVSTGGFSSHTLGIGYFDNIFVSIITIVFMFIAAANINLYFLAKKRGIKEILKEEEIHFYCLLMLIAGGIVALYNVIINKFDNIGGTILDAYFQIVSIVSTTGYTTADYNIWPTFSKFIILALFFVGGCASSTAGGIKCVRIYGGFKLIMRGIYLKIHPNIISPVTFNHKEMSNDTAIRISNFIFTYMTMMALGTIALSIDGFDFMTNLSASASCLGNIGPGFNSVGPNMNYALFSPISKYICTFLMIAGRVELYAILVLFSRNYWNPNKLR